MDPARISSDTGHPSCTRLNSSSRAPQSLRRISKVRIGSAEASAVPRFLSVLLKPSRQSAGGADQDAGGNALFQLLLRRCAAVSCARGSARSSPSARRVHQPPLRDCASRSPRSDPAARVKTRRSDEGNRARSAQSPMPDREQPEPAHGSRGRAPAQSLVTTAPRIAWEWPSLARITLLSCGAGA